MATPRIFITAFEPYDGWSENSSWLALVEFTKQLSSNENITTRLYPVDFDTVAHRLRNDLEADYDFALHLGQAPGAALVKLEAIGLNVGGRSEQRPEEFHRLVEDGPVAYQSALPLAAWSNILRSEGIPTAVSYHAGSYLCNATLYLSHFFAETMNLKTQTAFVHLPLDFSQTLKQGKELPGLPSSVAGRALHIVVKQLLTRERAHAQELA
ncbi:MAG: pyroglutamyl-peptidase I [Planctomycetes bacterium]|nr:pyroglutamyl-peptidase I [Planctomycetota bacterium]